MPPQSILFFQGNLTTRMAFLASPVFAELLLAGLRPHIVNNCPSQCHVLNTGITTPLSQHKWDTNNRLPNSDLCTCGCPGSRQYRYVVEYLWQSMTGRVGGFMPDRLQ